VTDRIQYLLATISRILNFDALDNTERVFIECKRIQIKFSIRYLLFKWNI